MTAREYKVKATDVARLLSKLEGRVYDEQSTEICSEHIKSFNDVCEIFDLGRYHEVYGEDALTDIEYNQHWSFWFYDAED